jgi:hypothetical protein
LKERDNLEDLNLDGKNTEMFHTENNFGGGGWTAFVALDRYQWRTLASIMTKFSVPFRQKNFSSILVRIGFNTEECDPWSHLTVHTAPVL